MNRYHLVLLTAMTACAGALHGQSSNPLSTEVKQAYTNVKGNILKAAEKMPEENYSFKAAPEVRPFGQLIAHVADAQMRTCSAFKGEQKAGTAASKTSKADLVAALKASFDECDGAYDSLIDTAATEMIKTGRGQRSRLGALVGNTAHDNEMYGTMSVYMRLKGVVPPSSEGR